MAGNTSVRKDSQDDQKKETRNTKRRKLNTTSSTAAVHEPKPRPTIKAKPTEKPLKTANPIERIFTTPKPPAKSLVELYYFTAPQENNSVEDLGIWERPTAEPNKLRALLKAKAVGMTDANKIAEREDRMAMIREYDDWKFVELCLDYGDEAARAYITPPRVVEEMAAAAEV